MSADMNQRVGYFDSPIATEPAFDPGLDIGCPKCDKPLTPETCRTISVMGWNLPQERSYFYRIHRKCHDRLTIFEEGELDMEALR